jgi:hypothetical protein
MILQIAIGVCLGIVGAVFLLRRWKVVGRVSVQLAVVAGVCLLGVFIHDRFSNPLGKFGTAFSSRLKSALR